MRQAIGALAMAVLLAMAPAGCIKTDHEGNLSIKPLKPTVDDLTAMALDVNDADRRRQGIVGLSQHPRGMDENILKVYAIVASNKNEDPTVRATALNVLGRAGNAKYVKVLLDALEEPRASLRWDAAAALDNVKDLQAVGPLKTHAQADTSMDVRAACVKALRHYKQQDVLSVLARCLGDGQFAVRRQAHASLVALTGTDAGYEPRDWTATIRAATTQPAR